MHQARKLWKETFGYFDKLEDRIRFRLSRHPITYAIIGAIGIILVWKGVWDFADEVHLTGIYAFLLGLIILLVWSARARRPGPWRTCTELDRGRGRWARCSPSS